MSQPQYLAIRADARRIPLASEAVDCVVTSPPYWGLRDYRVSNQIGCERTAAEFIAAMVAVFREVRRVLRSEGTLFLNLGDTYNAYNGGAGPGSKVSGNQTRERPSLPRGFGLRDTTRKPKDLIGIPWRVALALQADGWYLRADIIWHKPNPMPESVRDRPTKSHEYVFFLTKNERYYFGSDEVREPDSGQDHASIVLHKPEPSGGILPPHTGLRREAGRNGQGRNVRSVWTIPTMPFPGAHFATFPEELARRCILAGCPKGGTVFDPFGGAGTTAAVATAHDRRAIITELNPDYLAIATKRIERPHARQRQPTAKPLPLFDA